MRAAKAWTVWRQLASRTASSRPSIEIGSSFAVSADSPCPAASSNWCRYDSTAASRMTMATAATVAPEKWDTLLR